jgi:hypothetical protein
MVVLLLVVREPLNLAKKKRRNAYLFSTFFDRSI